MVNFLYLILDKKYFARDVVPNFAVCVAYRRIATILNKFLKSHVGMELFRTGNRTGLRYLFVTAELPLTTNKLSHAVYASHGV